MLMSLCACRRAPVRTILAGVLCNGLVVLWRILYIGGIDGHRLDLALARCRTILRELRVPGHVLATVARHATGIFSRTFVTPVQQLEVVFPAPKL